jgi:hypothetical protein
MEDLVQKVLIDILMALIGLASAYAVYYINKATAKVKAETENIADEKQRKLVQDALWRVEDLAIKTVESIEQTVAKETREAVKDGKVDRAELLALGTQAVDEIIGQLSEPTKTAIESEVNDLKTYVTSLVESAVLNLKR